MALHNGPVAQEITRLTGSRVTRATRLDGGDINDAHVVVLADHRELFVKSNARAPAMMFQREAEGLAWLGAVGALRVPEVIGIGERCLVLELIPLGMKSEDFDETLGRGLARLHGAAAATWGLATDNYIGTLAQSNRAHPTWAEFYRDERLLPLIERADGLFSAQDRRTFDAVLRRVDELVGDPGPPSRLHGDLWGGNVHVAEDGHPVLIDPACYGGDREIDLAMMRLFGGFTPRTFAAYTEALPLRPGHPDRLPLYQLYPLLAHVNLFGHAYVPRALEAARTYL